MLDLYLRLAALDAGNVVVSPYSVEAALGMGFAGAEGKTALEMGRVLGQLEPAAFHQRWGRQASALRSSAQESGARLNVANALWGQRGHPFRKGFLDLVERQYGGHLESLDFKTDPERCRETINSWVGRQTEDKIRQLLGPGSLQNDSRLVLTNAVYFKAAWDEPFDEKRTTAQPFFTADGKQASVPLMVNSQMALYAENSEFQAVDIPYRGDRLSMTILLPRRRDGLFALEKKLDSALLQSLIGGLKHERVILRLPRFRFEFRKELSETLKAMGMNEAFRWPGADFSGIDGTRDLYVSLVIHQATIEVNESGTEATAATAMSMRAGSAPMTPVEFRADHPFLFLIRERSSGAVLFIGRLARP